MGLAALQQKMFESINGQMMTLTSSTHKYLCTGIDLVNYLYQLSLHRIQ